MTLPDPARIQSVVILRAHPGVGDFLCAVPAWRALRAALPGARTTLVGLPVSRELMRRFPRYLDDFVEFPGFPGFPDRPPRVREIPGFLAGLQAQEFDLALQMHGSGIYSTPLTALFGARHTAGFHLADHYAPEGEAFFPFPKHLPEPLRWLHLLERLGIEPRGTELELPADAHDRRVLAEVREAHGLVPGRYAVLHPGASKREKCWPAERFARVGEWLAGRGVRVVLTGTAAEAPLAHAVRAAMRAPALDLTGRTPLGALALLLRDARLLVSNDTGVSHVAAAVRTPSVVLFLEGLPARWAPLDRERHRALGEPPDRVPTVDEVLAEADALLAGEHARVA